MPQPSRTTPAKRTAKPSPEKLRTRILDAAIALFEEKGSGGLSMRAIAARAGMPTMTVYGYFRGKTEIIRALWSLAFGPMFEELQALEQSIDEPVARLRAVAIAYVDYWMRFPDRYRMVFLVEDRREASDDKWFIEETDVVPAYLRFGPLIGAARGAMSGDFAREAEALVCALTGIAHMSITVSEYPWATPAIYVDAILAGVLGNDGGPTIT